MEAYTFRSSTENEEMWADARQAASASCIGHQGKSKWRTRKRIGKGDHKKVAKTGRVARADSGSKINFFLAESHEPPFSRSSFGVSDDDLDVSIPTPPQLCDTASRFTIAEAKDRIADRTQQSISHDLKANGRVGIVVGPNDPHCDDTLFLPSTYGLVIYMWQRYRHHGVTIYLSNLSPVLELPSHT